MGGSRLGNERLSNRSSLQCGAVVIGKIKTLVKSYRAGMLNEGEAVKGIAEAL